MKIQLTPSVGNPFWASYDVRGADGNRATFTSTSEWNGLTELRNHALGILIVEITSVTRPLFAPEIGIRSSPPLDATVIRASPAALAFIGLPEEPTR